MANSANDQLIRQVSDAHGFADAKIARLREDAQGKIACKPGCDHCCHRIVVAGVSELIRIAAVVTSTFTKEQQDILKKSLRPIHCRVPCRSETATKCWRGPPAHCSSTTSVRSTAYGRRRAEDGTLTQPRHVPRDSGDLGPPMPKGDTGQVAEAQTAMATLNQSLAEDQPRSHHGRPRNGPAGNLAQPQPHPTIFERRADFA